MNITITYEEAAIFMEVDRFSISKDELKKKFRELSFKYHPDTSSIQNAQELFVKLQSAYDRLKDEVPFKKKNQDFSFGKSNKKNDEFFEDAFNFGSDYNSFKNTYNKYKFFEQYKDKFERLDPYYDKWKTTSSGNHYFIIDEVCFIVYKKKEDNKYYIQIKIKKYGEEVIMDIKKQSFYDLTDAQYYIKHTLINNLFSNIKLKI